MKKRIALALAFGSAVFVAANAQQKWSLSAAAAPYKGSKITLATVAWTDAIKAISADFSKETGIAVEVVQIPGAQILEKTLLELRNKGTSFDLFTATYKRPYTKAGVVTQLRPFLNSSLADPDWNRNGFTRSSNFFHDPDKTSNVISIPFGASGMALFYRKDLFADPKHQAAFKSKYRRELTVPRNWNDVEKVAEYFSSADWKSFTGAKGYGVALAATRTGDPLMWQFALQSGGLALEKGKSLPALLDRSNNLAFEPYSTDALARLQRLTKFAQPSYLQTDDTAARELFLSGGAAMVATWDSFLGRLGSGEIANKWALGAMPSRTLLGGWSLMLNPHSKNQSASFLLAQYLSSAESDVRMFELAGRYPARASSYKVASYKAKNPYGEILSDSKERGMLQVDSQISSQFNAAIAEGTSLLLAGQLDAAAASEKIKTTVTQLLSDAGLK
jgi:multiple sugar transport system substrate-binding protein